MQKNYHPILTNRTREIFKSYIDCINIPEIDYFAIGLQNATSKKSISIMSNETWQKLFSENRYASHDPLRLCSLLTKREIITLDTLDCISTFGKEIMRQRRLNGIKNGIVFMKRIGKYSYMITLGTGFSRFDSFQFLKRYHDKISFIKNDFIKIIEEDSQAFIRKTSPFYSSLHRCHIIGAAPSISTS